MTAGAENLVEVTVLVTQLKFDAIVQEVEQMTYELLLQSAEALSTSRTINGITLHFSAEAYRVEPDGDIHVCLDTVG